MILSEARLRLKGAGAMASFYFYWRVRTVRVRCWQAVAVDCNGRPITAFGHTRSLAIERLVDLAEVSHDALFPKPKTGASE